MGVKMTNSSCNGWKWVKIAGNDWKLMERGEMGEWLEQLKRAANGCNSWKLLNITRNAWNGWE